MKPKHVRPLTSDEVAKAFERGLGLRPGTLARDAPYKEGVFKGPFWDLIRKDPKFPGWSLSR